MYQKYLELVCILRSISILAYKYKILGVKVSKEKEIIELIEDAAYKKIRKYFMKNDYEKYSNFSEYLSDFELLTYIESNETLQDSLIVIIDPDVSTVISKRDVMRCMLEDMSFGEVRALEGFVSHDDMYEDFKKEFIKNRMEKLKSSCSLVVKLRDSMQRAYKKKALVAA